MTQRTAVSVILLRTLVNYAQAGGLDGHQVFDKWCAPCHAPGPNHPGTTALTALYKGTRPGALQQRTDLNSSTITVAVRQGVYSMPFFRKTEISDAELEALIRYLANPTK
jgi:mono/diheme cytochrome c family protein